MARSKSGSLSIGFSGVSPNYPGKSAAFSLFLVGVGWNLELATIQNGENAYIHLLPEINSIMPRQALVCLNILSRAVVVEL